MPTYDYKCSSCQKTAEIKQKISEPALTHCPFCDAETFKRIPSKEVSIQFKGSGFYINDYGKPKTPDSNCGHGGCNSCNTIP